MIDWSAIGRVGLVPVLHTDQYVGSHLHGQHDHGIQKEAEYRHYTGQLHRRGFLIQLVLRIRERD